MNDNQLPTQETLKLITDEPLLKDAKSPAKWPWFLAAFSIVLVVLGFQFGLKVLMQHFTHKNEVLRTLIADENNDNFKALTIPVASKSDQKPRVFNPLKPTYAVERKEHNASSEEVARLQALLKIQERKKRLDEEKKMRLSSAVLELGVPLQSSAVLTANGTGSFGGFGQNSNTAYLNSISNQPIQEVNAGVFGDLRFRIRKGKVLRGVTESAIDSDLPGLIRGHLTENIYGDKGDIVLLPNGASLIGEYRSGGISNGQINLFVVWTRVQLSNGIYATIDSPSSDPLGRAGMSGEVDHHYFQRYGSSFLSSFFSISVATLGVNASDRYNSQAAYRQGLSNSFGQTANQEFQQYASIQNTIRPPQGTEITIMVNKDLSFEQALASLGGQP